MRTAISRKFASALVVIAILGVATAAAVQAAVPVSADIQQAQEVLGRLGYDTGTADGTVGPRTRAAIKAYQKAKGLRRTGKLDDVTLAAIQADAPQQPAAMDASNTAPTSTAPTSSSAGLFWVIVIIASGAALLFIRAARKDASSDTAGRLSSTGKKDSAMGVRIVDFTANGPKTTYQPSPKTREVRTPDAPWTPLGQSVTVAGLDIPGGVYVGSELRRQDGYGGENCLIDPSLKVSSTEADFYGAAMPYWPSYSLIQPQCRREYLRWLSGGRSDPAEYIGYVFLYFYGLERRLMLDDPGTEAPALLAEARRLLEIYGDNHSFHRYGAALISAASAKLHVSADWPQLSFQKTSWQIPLDLLIAIGSTIAAGTPLDAIQMLSWYAAHPQKRLPALAGRCPEEFKSLFKTRFEAKFPGGLVVLAPDARLLGDYRAASSTFTVKFQVGGAQIPDVSSLIAPLAVLDEIVESCVSDLSTYARLIGKDHSTRNDMAAAAALPEQLMTAEAAGPLARLKQWLEKQVPEQAAIAALGDLLNQVGIDAPADDKPRMNDLIFAANALARCGFGLEPDAKLSYAAVTTMGQIVLFRSRDRMETASPEFLNKLAHIDIGMIIAAADGNVAPSEIGLLRDQVMRSDELSDAERARLSARLLFLSHCPPKARVFGKFKDRPQEDREAIARLAITVAMADGIVAADEVRALEKLYKVLGLDTASLYSQLQSAGSDEPPIVAVGRPSKTISIPPRPTPVGVTSPPHLAALDMTRLAKTRADTAVVSSILGEIFSDESNLPGKASILSPPILAVPASANAPSRFPGLDPRYSALLAAIAQQQQITRGDFAALAGARNLMCDGAIEAINDWSYAKFDEPLLDDGPQILINQTIINRAESVS